jgi:hypothetical protein
VVAQHAGMDLHHQAVLAGQLSHLVKHVRGERVDLDLARLSSAENAGVQPTGCARFQRGRVGQQVA